MKLARFFRRMGCLALTGAVCLGLGAPAAAVTYNDFDYITSHVNLRVPGSLRLTRPAGDTSTTSAYYFITGDSDPGSPLTMNGEEITTRGVLGSFGVYVPLEGGVNTFTFQNGDAAQTVTITRGSTAAATTISDVRSMAPSYDCATFSGEQISLPCTAP